MDIFIGLSKKITQALSRSPAVAILKKYLAILEQTYMVRMFYFMIHGTAASPPSLPYEPSVIVSHHGAQAFQRTPLGVARLFTSSSCQRPDIAWGRPLMGDPVRLIPMGSNVLVALETPQVFPDWVIRLLYEKSV
jgi:hypothetical protein